MTNREIDALVAEHVMGWQSLGDCWATGSTHKDRQMKKQHFNPSECISDAWLVVEKMEDKDFNFSINNCVDPDFRYNTGYDVIFTDEDKNTYGITEDTAPMAIALAALKALGVKYE